MKVQRVTAKNTDVLNAIVETLLTTDAQKPSASHLQTLLSDDRTYLLALSVEKEVIAYALAYRFPSLYSPDFLAYLYDIEVRHEHRRKGAGRLLMKTMCELLKRDSVVELWLGTATDNVEGQALFTATGGLRSGETFNDFSYDLS